MERQTAFNDGSVDKCVEAKSEPRKEAVEPKTVMIPIEIAVAREIAIMSHGRPPGKITANRHVAAGKTAAMDDGASAVAGHGAAGSALEGRGRRRNTEAERD